MKDWELGQRIELEPNDGFYLEPKPSVEKVTYLLSGGSALTMYENDEIDLTGVGINDIERVRDPNEPLNADLVDTGIAGCLLHWLQHTGTAFRRPEGAPGAQHGDRQGALANEILAGLVAPADGILPPGMPGFNDDPRGSSSIRTRREICFDEAGGPRS